MSNLKKDFKKFAISNKVSNQVRGGWGWITVTCRNSRYEIVTVQEQTWEMVQRIIAQNGYTECGFVSDGGF
ncbi:hypothetical protein V9L05_16245 [Bernardetia sp. Wsw4-3y2]|uniref:hypothetical protein n=1 Tax=unclassified Bernardetia TaxID=2647129 RepID=UPI0030CBD0CF